VEAAAATRGGLLSRRSTFTVRSSIVDPTGDGRGANDEFLVDEYGTSWSAHDRERS